MADFNEDEDAGRQSAAAEPEARGVVWIQFYPQGQAPVSYPMAGVPRVGEFVDLAGPMVASSEAWVVTGVVWVVPTGYEQRELLELNLGDLPAVRVHLDRVKKR